MKANKILSKYTRHTQRWLMELENFTDGTFTAAKPGEWSTAQVVDHICNTTRKCVENALLCSQNKGEKGHWGIGPAIFSAIGAFPPVKIKIKTPPPGTGKIYTPENISLNEARLQLNKALVLMQKNKDIIQQSHPSVRIAHWAGGWFNGVQWYQNAEMHIKHHFRQLKRIKKNLTLQNLTSENPEVHS